MADQVAMLRELALQQRPRLGSLRIISVTSGKGGVGKTNFTINLALALTADGYRVAVLDGDLGLANINIACGINPQYTLTDLINGDKTIEEILVQGPGGICIIAGSSGMQELANLGEVELKRVIENFERMEQLVDILLIDTGAGSGNNVVRFLEASDEVILLTTPEPTALTDAYGLLKILNLSNTVPVSVVINRVKTEMEARATYQRLEIAVRKFLHGSTNLLGWVYEDQHVGRAVMAQEPLGICYPKSSAFHCIQWIARFVVGHVSPVPQKKSGIRKLLDSVLRAID